MKERVEIVELYICGVFDVGLHFNRWRTHEMASWDYVAIINQNQYIHSIKDPCVEKVRQHHERNFLRSGFHYTLKSYKWSVHPDKAR